jgi:hypothetical protein
MIIIKTRRPKKMVRNPNSVLEGRFYASLAQKLQAQEIDEQYIDRSMDYWENKRNLEAQFHINLTSRDPLKHYAKYYESNTIIEVPKAKLAKVPRIRAEIIKPEKVKKAKIAVCQPWPEWKDSDIT